MAVHVLSYPQPAAENFSRRAFLSSDIKELPINILDAHVKVTQGYRAENGLVQDHRWVTTTGKALREFLQHAKYPAEPQARALEFFRTLVVPYLGPFPSTGQQSPPWNSFMTDNGLPIELSWDWGGQNGKSRVRFTSEPVGWEAGTERDPQNRFASLNCVRQLEMQCDGFRSEWYHHLARQLRSYELVPCTIYPGHQSRIFLGFDIDEHNISVKAYFMTNFTARLTHRADLDVVKDAITGIPHVCPKRLAAFSQIEHYLRRDQISQKMTVEFLSIDCIDPIQARMKIYVRSPDTSFGFVNDIITLGGTIVPPGYIKGLEQLRHLWNLLFPGSSDHLIPRSSSDPRTIGTLFNFELRHGNSMPLPKVYLPVRHYCASENHILSALQKYHSHYDGNDNKVSGYVNALRATIAPKYLATETGIQTWLSCSFKSDGLQLAVYVDTQPDKLKWVST